MTVRVSAFGIITLLGRTQPENGSRRSNPAIPLQDSFISKTMPVWGPIGPDTARILSHSPRRESVYATLLLMSSTLGGDVAPAPGAVPAPGGCIGAQRPPPVATPEAAIASDCSIASALATPQRDRGAAAAASPPLTAVPLQRLRFLPQCPSLPPVAAAARPSPLRAAIPAPPAVATAAIGSTSPVERLLRHRRLRRSVCHDRRPAGGSRSPDHRRHAAERNAEAEGQDQGRRGDERSSDPDPVAAADRTFRAGRGKWDSVLRSASIDTIAPTGLPTGLAGRPVFLTTFTGRDFH